MVDHVSKRSEKLKDYNFLMGLRHFHLIYSLYRMNSNFVTVNPGTYVLLRNRIEVLTYAMKKHTIRGWELTCMHAVLEIERHIVK